MLTGANNTIYRQNSVWWYPSWSYSARKNTVITFPSFQNDIWRLNPHGNGSLKSVATAPGPAFKKEAPATMFDAHKKFLRFKVFKKMSFSTWQSERTKFLKRLVSFVKSAFALILCPYQLARSLSSAVQVSVNNSIQLSSMPRFCLDDLLTQPTPSIIRP